MHIAIVKNSVTLGYYASDDQDLVQRKNPKFSGGLRDQKISCAAYYQSADEAEHDVAHIRATWNLNADEELVVVN